MPRKDVDLGDELTQLVQDEADRTGRTWLAVLREIVARKFRRPELATAIARPGRPRKEPAAN